MTDLGDKAKERFLRTTQPPEVEGVKIDWSPLPHPAIRDLRGMRFGKLLVKAYSHTREQANGIPCVYWLCQCDCGNDRPVARDQLLRKGTSSCGCLSIMGNKGVLNASKTHQKHSHMTKRMRYGLPPVAPTEVIGDPANVFAYDSLMAYACLQWAGYEPAAHHHLIAKYLEKVEKGKIKRLMIFMPPRSGKLLANNTPVITYDGIKPHGELVPGDKVFSIKGHPIDVVAVSAYDWATLEISFSNGDTIKCHKLHEWPVCSVSKYHGVGIITEVLETHEIAKRMRYGNRFFVPPNEATAMHPGNQWEGSAIYFDSIKECEPEIGRCIQVNSKDGLYLVGASFIPTHNSMIVSEYFPAWYLGKNPDKRIIATSYGQELASDFGRKVRNQIADPMYGEIFPDVGLSGDSAASDKFDMAPPHKGGYFAVGAGGAITGRGANCLLGDAKIVTNRGFIEIKEICRYNTPLMALAFSEEKAAFVWSPIVALSRRKTHDLVRVSTDKGSIVCTPEHPFYIEGEGYIEAGKTTPTQSIRTCEMRALPTGIYEGSKGDRVCEGEGKDGNILLFAGLQAEQFKGMRESQTGCSSYQELRELREDIQAETGKGGYSKILFIEMLLSDYWKGIGWPTDDRDLPIMWKRISQETGKSNELLKGMCGYNALNENEGERELQLPGRRVHCEWDTEGNDAGDYGERWVAVCCLPCNGESSCPSHRSQPGKQYNGEYGNALQFMPHESPQVGKAAICMVESIHNNLVEVYDIEIQDYHNFVVLNDQDVGLIVKNCLIIDDPVKSREDSDSEASRRKIKDWYTAVAYTRLMDDGAIIICQTRWHTEDLSGWLLKEHKHEKWTVLNLPAINEQGEALWPERFPLSVLENIRKTLPARDWEALYQQRPFIEEGNIYKRQWWNLWPDTKPLPECEFIIQSWDTAYSDADRKKSSYSARVTLGVFKRVDDEFHNIILIEYWKGRVEYPELRKESLRAYQDYEPDKVIIEKKASGNSLIQDLRRGGLPLATYTPEKDKITRAYAAQSLLENGRLYYPARKWAEEFISALARFPNPDDDDVADAFSQAIIWLQSSFLVAHADDAKRRQREDEEDEDLPSNVTRFKPKKKRAAYG